MSLDTRRRSANASQGARSLRRELYAASAPSLAPVRCPLDWVAVALLMLAAAFVFFWNLTASGYANEFYSAAAQAGSKSWEAFLWGSLDAGNAITVDKPPASIWLMALSVRLLGLSSFAILLPQALMGVACTYLLYATVRRVWGNAAGIVAGIVFITTPVAALMFRFNNPDALLILLMLGAAACVLRGLELPADRHGNRVRTCWYAVAGLLIGLGFLTKQFQVLLVLPGFGLAMLLLSPTTWPRRLLDAVVALGAMVIGAGWWVLLTVLVPSGSRPYFGGSQTDSFIELTFSYNGLGRLTGNETGSVIPGASEALSSGSQGGMWGETGLFRLWTSDFGDQITWLAPIAFAAIILGLIAAKPAKKGQVYFGRFYLGKREDSIDLDTVTRIRRTQIVIFGAWLIMTWLVFSFMAGIFHAYYTVALSPAIAVLVAICGASLLELRNRPWMPGVAGLLIAATGAWDMALILRSGSYAWLGVCVGVLSVAAGLVLCIVAFWMQHGTPAVWPTALKRGMLAVAGVGLVAIFAGPIAWTACTIATGHTGSIVTAGPSGNMGGGPGGGGMGGGPGGNGAADGGPGGNGAADGSAGASDNSNASSSDASTDDGQNTSSNSAPTGGGSGLLGGGSANESLVELLTQNASGYRWVAATTDSQNAASYQLASELPVMAIGGFNGSDPAPTLDEFKVYVAQGLIRYYIASGGMGGGMGGTQMGGSSAASEIAKWVAQNYTAQTIGNTTVYDLQE